MDEPNKITTEITTETNTQIANWKKDFHFKPLKDSILIALSVLIIGAILLPTFLLRPTNSNVHVEIRYGDTLLWDKDDPEKNTNITFPESGEKRLVYTKEDGKIFLDNKKSFDFVGESVTITLYSDKSIQIKKEDISCPDHFCSRFGKVSYTYTPVACLPNHITAMIVADGFPEYDA